MSRWRNWTEGKKKGLSLDSFLKEQQSPAEMAQSMGLQSDGSGGYIDPSTGEVVARTVNNELVFYDPMGGAISAQSDGAQLTSDQPSWVDPVTGELTVPPGQPESPEEISAIPDPIPAQAPPGYNAFMNRKKKEMYANQTTPEDAEQNLEAQAEDPEMGFPDPGPQNEQRTFKEMMLREQQPISNPGPPPRGYQKGHPQFKGYDSQLNAFAQQERNKPQSTKPVDTSSQMRDNRMASKGEVMPPSPQPRKDRVPAPQVSTPQTKSSPDEFKEKTEAVKSDPNATIGEKVESLDDLFRGYGDGLTNAIKTYKTEEADVLKEHSRLMKPIQKIFDDGNIDENQKRILLRHGAKMLGGFKGRRKDEAFNDLSDSMINGILERAPMLREAYALDEDTGLPNPDKIRQFKQDHRVNDFDENLVKSFWKGLPASVKKNFGGQEISDFEGFSDWLAMDGIDLLSGQYLDPESINIDHSVASNFASGPDTPQELVDFINSKDNMISMAKQVNQTLLSKTKPQFLDDLEKQFGQPESRIEGLQDFIYGLNEPKFTLPGNFPKILRDTLLEDTEDGRTIFKQGLGENSIGDGLGMANQTNNEILDVLEGKLKEFDKDGFLDMKQVRGLDDAGKNKLSQLRRGKQIIQKLRGNAGIHDIFGLLGDKKLSRSFYPTSIRGADFAGKEGSDLFKHVKTDLLQQMAGGMSPEDQMAMQDNWESSLASANGTNRNRWNEQHGGRANGRLIDSDGMSQEQMRARDREITDEAERNMMQTLMDSGLIRQDMIPDNLKNRFEEIIGRKRLFENVGELGSEDYHYDDDDGGDTFFDLLGLIGELQDGGIPEEPKKPMKNGLTFEDFRRYNS